MDIRQADRIADSLEEMVFTGHFGQGERLDETSLAQMFGVSRTPVREALQRLVGVDLAEQRPRRGVFVKQPMSRRVIEMFETMAEIEAVCGRLAAERMEPDALNLLRAINAECENAVSVPDPDAYSRCNQRFHFEIYSLADNSFLAQQAAQLFDRLKPFRRVQFRLRDRMAQSVVEHDALITAMANKDLDRVTDVMRAHVGPQGERFPEQMRRLRRAVANSN